MKLYTELSIHEKINVRSTLPLRLDRSRMEYCLGNKKNSCINMDYEQPVKLDAFWFSQTTKKYLFKNYKTN